MDRWSLVATLNYLSHDAGVCEIVLAKAPEYDDEEGRRIIAAMVTLADPPPDPASSPATCRR